MLHSWGQERAAVDSVPVWLHAVLTRHVPCHANLALWQTESLAFIHPKQPLFIPSRLSFHWKAEWPPVSLEDSSVCKWPWCSAAPLITADLSSDTGRSSTSAPLLLWALPWLWWGGELCHRALMEMLQVLSNRCHTQDEIKMPLNKYRNNKAQSQKQVESYLHFYWSLPKSERIKALKWFDLFLH